MNGILVSFTVVGKPAQQGSKRHVGGGRMIESNERLRPWREAVAAAAGEAYTGPVLRDVPFEVFITFYRPRPKSHFGTGRNADKLKPSAAYYPTGRPDTLKLARAIEDALTGVVWHDDAQIVDCAYVKRWGDRFETRIEIRRRQQNGCTENGGA